MLNKCVGNCNGCLGNLLKIYRLYSQERRISFPSTVIKYASYSYSYVANFPSAIIDMASYKATWVGLIGHDDFGNPYAIYNGAGNDSVVYKAYECRGDQGCVGNDPSCVCKYWDVGLEGSSTWTRNYNNLNSCGGGAPTDVSNCNKCGLGYSRPRPSGPVTQKMGLEEICANSDPPCQSVSEDLNISFRSLSEIYKVNKSATLLRLDRREENLSTQCNGQLGCSPSHSFGCWRARNLTQPVFGGGFGDFSNLGDSSDGYRFKITINSNDFNRNFKKIKGTVYLYYDGQINESPCCSSCGGAECFSGTIASEKEFEIKNKVSDNFFDPLTGEGLFGLNIIDIVNDNISYANKTFRLCFKITEIEYL